MPQQLVVVVDTIQCNIRLVAASAIHSSATTVLPFIHLGVVLGSDEDDSGLQAQNADWVSSFERQVLELLGPEGMSQCRVRGVHQSRRASNLDGSRLALNSYGEFERGRTVHLDPPVFFLRGSESRGGPMSAFRC